MKHILIIFFVAFSTFPCAAQWRYVGFGPLTGVNVGTVQALGVHDTFIFAGYAGDGILRYIPSTNTWGRANTGLDLTQGNITSFASLGKYLFAGMTRSTNGHPATSWRTGDNGASWKASAAGNVCTADGYVLNATGGIWRSKDSGAYDPWEQVSTFSATYLVSNGGCVFASNASSVWRSTDTGTNWAKTSPPVGLSISAFAVIGTQMFAGGTGVFRSLDAGQNWRQLGLAKDRVRALAVFGTYLFAGTDTGVFVSLDSGINWRYVSEGMGTRTGYQRDVTALAVLDTQLFAAVFTGTDDVHNQYGYVAARPISEMVPPKSAVQAVVPVHDTLAIYPNPATGVVTIFAGSTIIERVSVLSVLGVETGSGFRGPGSGEITLDLSHLPSGSYFLRIQTASSTVLRKVVRE